MAQKKQAIHNSARTLGDKELYIIQIFDVSPSGVLVRAYQQTSSVELFMSVTEGELLKADLGRDDQSLIRLAESIDLVDKGGKTFLESSLSGIVKPKSVPSDGDSVRQFIEGTKAGDQNLPQLLTKGLAELSKEKPAGKEAVRWLGNWLLENNPNKPQVTVAE